MKKILFVLFIASVLALLSSCAPIPNPFPTSPDEVLPYCQAEYEKLLEINPDFPPAYVGACVAAFQSGEPTAFVALCGYEPFWEMIGDPEITSRKECMDYLRNYESE